MSYFSAFINIFVVQSEPPTRVLYPDGNTPRTKAGKFIVHLKIKILAQKKTLNIALCIE